MDNLEWLHKRMRSHLSGSSPGEGADDGPLPGRPFAPAVKRGRAALDLVDQAADLVRSIEDHAYDSESRARGLAEDAVKRLQASEKEIQRLEKKQAAAEACIEDIRTKLQQTADALERERERVRAAENLLPQLEMRARAAEARAAECENALSRIENAIRTKLLRDGSSTHKRANAA